eukprot:214316-Prymnesium_polylepis.1
MANAKEGRWAGPDGRSNLSSCSAAASEPSGAELPSPEPSGGPWSSRDGLYGCVCAEPTAAGSPRMMTEEPGLARSPSLASVELTG